MRSTLRVVGGATLGAFTGFLAGVPIAMAVTGWLLFSATPDQAGVSAGEVEGGMAVFFSGVLGSWVGFRAGASAGFVIALFLEGCRQGSVSENAVTLGALATALIWIALATGLAGNLDDSFTPLIWIVATVGMGWTVLATLFARSRARTIAADRTM